MSGFFANLFKLAERYHQDRASLSDAGDDDFESPELKPTLRHITYRVILSLDGYPDMTDRPAIVAGDAASFIRNEFGGLKLQIGKEPILECWRERGKEDPLRTFRYGPDAHAVEVAINSLFPPRQVSNNLVKEERKRKDNQDPYNNNFFKILEATLWVADGRLHRDPNEGPAVVIRETHKGQPVQSTAHYHESYWLNGEKVEAPKPARRSQPNDEQVIVY